LFTIRLQKFDHKHLFCLDHKESGRYSLATERIKMIESLEWLNVWIANYVHKSYGQIGLKVFWRFWINCSLPRISISDWNLFYYIKTAKISTFLWHKTLLVITLNWLSKGSRRSTHQLIKKKLVRYSGDRYPMLLHPLEQNALRTS